MVFSETFHGTIQVLAKSFAMDFGEESFKHSTRDRIRGLGGKKMAILPVNSMPTEGFSSKAKREITPSEVEISGGLDSPVLLRLQVYLIKGC